MYVDPETRFHSVDLAYAINDYQRSKREVFSFRFFQSEYGAVELCVSVEPLAGAEALKDYIERAILARTGNVIVVNALVGDVQAQQTEKSYFVQKIKQPSRGVATV